MSATALFATPPPRITPQDVHRVLDGSLLGATLAEFDGRQVAAVAKVIAAGITEGRTTQQILRAVCGSRALGYADAILPVTRRSAAAIVQTAIAGAVNGGEPAPVDQPTGRRLDAPFPRFANIQRQLGLQAVQS